MEAIAKPNTRSRGKSPVRSARVHRVSNCAEGSDWAERSNYWLWQSEALGTSTGPRQRSAPLILCGHGISLNVDRGTLLIRDGFTHYPQPRAEHRIFPGDPTRPSRILVVDGSGNITFDVIDWLREQDIALVRVDWRGGATVIAGRDGYAVDPAAWRRQEALRADPKKRLAIGRRLIRQKLERSLETLETCLPDTKRRSFANEVISDKLAMLRSRQALDRQELHGIEGRAAKVYFDAWAGTPLRWRTSKRYPIPDTWRTICQRQSLVTGKKGKNRNASHPVNAMLNYAYAVLESQVRLDVLAHGYDPRGGFLHSGYGGSSALVLDMMEPLRPVVDAVVLKLALGETFSGADFILRDDGVCRLSPQLARAVSRRSTSKVEQTDPGRLLSHR